MTKRLIYISSLLVLILICWPPQWLPSGISSKFSQWFNFKGEQNPLNFSINEEAPPWLEEACPNDPLEWRASHLIEGVEILADLQCVVDMPDTIAVFVKGSNNVSPQTLSRSGLSADAIEKSQDLDGDGDPDVIHIRLEVIELNGHAPDSPELSAQYAIAPGVTPGLWVFAPKATGMATENFASRQARSLYRMPSPAIRIEQGDRVEITLENTHYLPHTIHFHGVDHAFLDEFGEGNDGVPITSEMPVQAGNTHTYNIQARQTGTMFYHCHVQAPTHAMMGLQGLFIVEENKPNNWLQTLNVGGGLVRAPSQASKGSFQREYDLHYFDIDAQLNNIIQSSNDPALIKQYLAKGYNPTQARSEFFTLNGHSFPYTFRESLIVTKPDEKIKLRVLNGGSVGVSLHTHGHKVTVTHNDGVLINPIAQVTRDVVWIAPAQRADIILQTSNDGLHSYGSGIWLLHDHQPAGVTTDGIGPGGNVSAIVYEEFLQDNGWPRTQGENLGQFFDSNYYAKEDNNLNQTNRSAAFDFWFLFRLIIIGLASGAIFALAMNRKNSSE